MERPQNELERFTLRKIIKDVLYVLNLEQGMGYTLKRLFLAPGPTIQEYLFEDRSRLTRPFQLIVLLVAVATFLTLLVLPDMDELMEELHKTEGWEDFTPAVQESMEWFTTNMKQYFNVFFLAGIPFISLATFLIFRQPKYHYAEHLVINTYLSCPQTLFFILYVPFIKASGFFAVFQIIPVVVYSIYAYKQLFKESLWNVIWKSTLCFLLYQFIFGLVMMLLFGILVFLKS
ncbi:MAG: DUF3667 domain-containing protein [Saprospiraceae bacterium]|nr:DUF3667 domain-containing protein [Saprospiraceae bacterium]